jgi:hypothetical protein
MKTLPTPPGIDTADFKYSHSITPDARFGFDDEGGLVWVRFRPEESNASVQDFVSPIEAPIQDAKLGCQLAKNRDHTHHGDKNVYLP